MRARHRDNDRSGSPTSPVAAGPVEDRQLLEALSSGDATAAAAVHDRVRPAVERTVSRLIGARDRDHQDLVQQALIELVSSSDRYRGDCPLNAWISSVTAHVVYKHLRHRQRERRIFDRSLCVESIRAGYHPGRRMAMYGLLSQLAGHLGDMNPTRVWAFMLHDVHGYDLEEVATIMRISVAAAQARLSRGRRELHLRIAADPDLAGAFDRSGV